MISLLSFLILLSNFSTSSNAKQLDRSPSSFDFNKNKCAPPITKPLKASLGINLGAPQAEDQRIGMAVALADISKIARPLQLLVNNDGKTSKVVFPEDAFMHLTRPCLVSNKSRAVTNVLESAEKGSVPNGIYSIYLPQQINISLNTGEQKLGEAKLVRCPVEHDIYKSKLPRGMKKVCMKLAIQKKLSSAGVRITFTKNPLYNQVACLSDLKIIMPSPSNRKKTYEKEILEGSKKVVFNQDYLNHLKPFSTLRLMNFMYASPRVPEACQNIQKKERGNKSLSFFNWNILTSPATKCIRNKQDLRTSLNRAKLTDLTWGGAPHTDKKTLRGFPIEVIKDLLIATKKDAWISLPHNAYKNYISELIEELKLVKSSNPNFRLYIEYSNEVWNGRFWGSKHLNSFHSHKYQKRPYNEIKMKLYQDELEEYVKRSINLISQFKRALGYKTVVGVLGTKQSDPKRTEKMLNYALKKHKSRFHLIDSIATATYFQACWSPKSKSEGIFCKEYFDASAMPLTEVKSPEDIIKILKDKRNPHSLPAIIEQIRKQKEILNRFIINGKRISLTAYEGGQHLTMDAVPEDIKYNPNVKYTTQRLTQWRTQYLSKLLLKTNRHPLMKDLYKQLYKAWKDLGGTTHVGFTAAQTESEFWGDFGICSNINSCARSYKYQATQESARSYCLGY